MKKIITFLLILLLGTSLYAAGLDNYLKSEEKPNVTIKVKSDIEFIKSQIMIFRDDLFQNKGKVSR